MNWQAELLRVTVFPVSSVQFDVAEWWTLVTGEAPEAIESKPKFGIYQAAGCFGKGRLILNIEPNRIDWLYTKDQQNNIENSFWIGDYLIEKQAFFKALEKWTPSCPPSYRIALGTILLETTDNLINGYHHLSKLLPAIKIDAENSFDFSYSINRPRFSKVLKNLKINRLSKWSVVTISLQIINPSVRQNFDKISETFACRLELDVNTTADQKDPLPQESLHKLFSELEKFTVEIAEKGDLS